MPITAKKNTSTDIYFDADMLIFQSCIGCEEPIEWADRAFTLHCDFNKVIDVFDSRVKELTQLVLDHYNIDGEYHIFMAITSTLRNFRKDIYPEYKANRNANRRPLCWLPMREWVRDNYVTLEFPHLEADDVIGLSVKPNDIAISGDKDFKTIPCNFYDMARNEYHKQTESDAHYWHMYQTLVGDSADNYKGCPTIGDKRAKVILAKGTGWDNVLKAFKAQGLTEEYALSQARVAYILRHKGDYNKDTGKVRLWTPDT